MKIDKMASPRGGSGEQPPNKSNPTDSAFDNWLNRGLHQIFDDVMNEPIPSELLKILQSDQKK